MPSRQEQQQRAHVSDRRQEPGAVQEVRNHRAEFLSKLNESGTSNEPQKAQPVVGGHRTSAQQTTSKFDAVPDARISTIRNNKRANRKSANSDSNSDNRTTDNGTNTSTTARTTSGAASDRRQPHYHHSHGDSKFTAIPARRTLPRGDDDDTSRNNYNNSRVESSTANSTATDAKVSKFSAVPAHRRTTGRRSTTTTATSASLSSSSSNQPSNVHGNTVVQNAVELHDATTATNADTNDADYFAAQISSAYLYDPAVAEEEALRRHTEAIRQEIINEAVVATPDPSGGANKHGQHRRGLLSSRRCLYICMMIIGLGVVGIVVVVLVVANNNNDSTTPASLTKEERLLELVAPISGRETVQDSTTLQHQAYQWILYDDPARLLDEPDEAILSSTTANPNAIDLDTTLVERYVLVLLYFMTNNNGSVGDDDENGWIQTLDFLTALPVCQWQLSDSQRRSTLGVRCNVRNAVDYIRLDNNNLVGRLPDELSALQDLEILSLAANKIEGTISASSLSQLRRLEFLQLSSNKFAGTIPDSFISLQDTLEEIYLDNNQLNGTIPPFMTRSGILKRLDLSHNLFTGTIRFGTTQQPTLEMIQLHHNQLSGRVLESMTTTTLPALEVLSLHHNRFTGSLPLDLSRMSRLREFDASDNQLTGTMPHETGINSELSLLDNIYSFSVESNMLSGTLPASFFAGMVDVVYLFLGSNRFNGTIPTVLGQLDRLAELELQSNRLTGTVPTAFASLTNLGYLFINDNHLVDNLTANFCDGIWLENIDFLNADCGGTEPAVECGCCTGCCSTTTINSTSSTQLSSNNEATRTTVCTTNFDAICRFYRIDLVELGKERGTNCTCTANGQRLSCVDTECQYCDNEICFRDNDSQGYGYTFSKDGIASSFVSVEYPDTNDQITFVQNYTQPSENEAGSGSLLSFSSASASALTFSSDCSVTWNGVQCNSCTTTICTDGFETYVVDCTNVQAGVRLNGCSSNENAGPLKSLLPAMEPLLVPGDEDDFERFDCVSLA